MTTEAGTQSQPTVTTTETSSPTAQPSPTSAETTASPPVGTNGIPSGEVPNEESFTFEGLGNDFDETGLEQVQTAPAVVPTAAKPPVVPQVTQQQQPPVVPQQPATQVAPPPVQPQVQQPPAPQTESTEDQPVTVDSVIDTMNKNFGNIVQSIAPAFVLSADQAAAIEADPIGELPKHLASTYARAVTTSLKYMRQLVPAIVQQVQQEAQIHTDAETRFFKDFPQLDRAKHGKDIIAFAQAFTNQNKNMTADQLLKSVGAAVMAKNGIAALPVKPVPGQPFMPASGSAPRVPTGQQPPSGNPFDLLGQDFDS